MQLEQVVSALGEHVRVIGDASVDVVDVTHDSRDVRPGTLFACLRGRHFDGHEFAAAAVGDGAVALLVDHELPSGVVGSATQLLVDDTRRRLGPIAAAVTGHPSRGLLSVGITGTNGKTTTAHLLASIFESSGRPTGLMGTLHGVRTTPEAPELQRTLASFLARGDRAAVLEVSSHALAMHRVDGTSFDAVVFTNLGIDHLDLHGSQEAYFRAKASLFRSEFSPLGVINVDDAHGRLLADAAAMDPAFRVVPYTLSDASDVEVGAASHRFTWRGAAVEVGIGGRFNVANALAAATTAAELGVPLDAIVAGLAAVGPVLGRFERVASDAAERLGITVVVDYAHTPDGLAEVLAAGRQLVSGDGRVVVVFGCGGERDQTKRPMMGRVAAERADAVVVTSDNPRHEDPQTIVDDVLGGVPDAYRDRVRVELDRRTAIDRALGSARQGDLVVIAGKGHELTQDLGDRVVDFDDRAVARELLERGR